MTLEEMQQVADRMCAAKKIPAVTVQMKSIRRGHAHTRTRRVSVPAWVVLQGRDYAIYYVIHEVCHIVSGQRKHNRQFQNVEVRWLATFGMRPVYDRAYPKRLLARDDGRTLWQTWKHPASLSRAAAGGTAQ
jgi:uncharacterized cupin superfamily protein